LRPHAIYALVQTVLVQDEALRLANARIEELQAQTSAAAEPEQRPASFLDSMREALGGRAPHGSVPSVRTAGGNQPQGATSHMSAEQKSAISKSCSDQANAKGLHGKARCVGFQHFNNAWQP
jgi:hypothetical protein